MTAPSDRSATAALAPVRAELLRRARADADAARAVAEEEVRRLREAAAAEAGGLLARAREQGVADATTVADAERVRAGREVRARELATQRAALEDLRTAALAAVRERWRDGADDPPLRDRLACAAHRLLGPDVVITDDPGGGIVARARGRRLDLTLEALTDRALDRLGDSVSGLWSA